MTSARRFLQAFSAAVHDKALEEDARYELYHFFDSDVLHRIVFGHRDALNHELIYRTRLRDGDTVAGQQLLMGALVGQRIGAPPRLRALPPHLYEVRLAVGRSHPSEEYSDPEFVIDLLGIRRVLRELLVDIQSREPGTVLARLLEDGPELFYGIELLSGHWQSRLGRLLKLDLHKGSPFDYEPDVVASEAFQVIADHVGQTRDPTGQKVAAANGLRDTMALAMLAQGIAEHRDKRTPPYPIARFYTETPRILHAWDQSREFRALLSYGVDNATWTDLGPVHGVLRTADYYLIRALIPELAYTSGAGEPRSQADDRGASAGDTSLFKITKDLTEAITAFNEAGVTDAELMGLSVGDSTLGEYMSAVTELSRYGGAWRRLMRDVPPGLPGGLMRDLRKVIEGERELDAALAATFNEHLRALSFQTEGIAAFGEVYADVLVSLESFSGAVRPVVGTHLQHLGLTRWGFSSTDIGEAVIHGLITSYEGWQAQQRSPRGGPPPKGHSRFAVELTRALHEIRAAPIGEGDAVEKAVAVLGFFWLIGEYPIVARYGETLLAGIVEAADGLYSVPEGYDPTYVEKVGGAVENMIGAAHVRALTQAKSADEAGAPSHEQLICKVFERVDLLDDERRRFTSADGARAITQGYALFHAWQFVNLAPLTRGQETGHDELADRSFEICFEALGGATGDSPWYPLLANHCLYVALVSRTRRAEQDVPDRLATRLIQHAATDPATWSYRFDDTLAYYFYVRAAQTLTRLTTASTDVDPGHLTHEAGKDAEQAAQWLGRIPAEVRDNEVVAHRALLRQLEVELSESGGGLLAARAE